MESTKPQFVKARYNPTSHETELVYIENGSEKILTLTNEMMNEMIEIVPLFDDEREIRKLMKEIYDMMHERLLSAKNIDDQIKALQTEHSSIRGKLLTAKNKTEVAKYSAYIKSLTGEKAALDTKRHLIKLLEQEESKLWAKLAEIEHGAKKE